VFWGCGDDIQVFALFATKFEADLCVFPAKFAKTRKLNQTFAYNDMLSQTGWPAMMTIKATWPSPFEYLKGLEASIGSL